MFGLRLILTTLSCWCLIQVHGFRRQDSESDSLQTFLNTRSGEDILALVRKGCRRPGMPCKGLTLRTLQDIYDRVSKELEDDLNDEQREAINRNTEKSYQLNRDVPTSNRAIPPDFPTPNRAIPPDFPTPNRAIPPDFLTPNRAIPPNFPTVPRNILSGHGTAPIRLAVKNVPEQMPEFPTGPPPKEGKRGEDAEMENYLLRRETKDKKKKKCPICVAGTYCQQVPGCKK